MPTQISYMRRPLLEDTVNAIVMCANKGVYIDKNEFLKELDNLNNECLTMYKLMCKEVGIEFNPDSPAQVRDVLINKLYIKREHLMHRGKVSTSSAIIENLKKLYPYKVFLPVFSEYRRKKAELKILTTLNGIVTETEVVGNDNQPLLWTPIQITIGVTGRIYTKSPNIQGFPNRLRRLIVAPKGFKILSVDIKQQEPTIFFHYVIRNKAILELMQRSADKYIGLTQLCVSRKAFEDKLINMVKHDKLKNNEMYAKYFSRVPSQMEVSKNINVGSLLNYNAIYEDILDNLVPAEKIDAETRKGYKTAIIAGGYGSSLDTLTGLAGEEIGTDIYHTYQTLPEYVDYKHRVTSYIASGGKVFVSLFGTCMECTKTKFYEKQKAGLNYPTQGTGSDLLKFNIEDISRFMEKERINSSRFRYIVPKHDESLFYIEDSLIDYVEPITDIISVKIEDWAVMGVEYSIGTSYMDK